MFYMFYGYFINLIFNHNYRITEFGGRNVILFSHLEYLAVSSLDFENFILL